ncbi:MAG: aromatic amino acid transport family protein [bacterium]|nr:aromatic amino acid transport family protein [bacterium]
MTAMSTITRGRDSFLAVGLLAGGIIGAGVFALPYAFSTAGLATGFFYLAIATGVYILLHLIYADILVKTSGEHRLVGLARQYLGRGAGALAVLIGVVQMVFVLTIYLVLSKSFLSLITSVGNTQQQIFLFWLLGSVAIFLKLRRIALSELLVTLSISAIIALIFILGIFHLDRVTAVPLFANPRHWLIPLPAILFALSGRVVIPAVVRFLRGRNNGEDNRRQIFKVILWGTLIPAIIYGLFVIGTIGLSAPVSEDAVIGLIGQISPALLLIIGVLGLFSLWSSYLLVGLDVYETLKLDLRMNKLWRLLIVVVAPLILYAAGFTSFLTLVSFVGGIFLVLEGLFVIAIYRKSHNIQSLFRGPHALTMTLAVIALLTALAAVIFGR